MYQAGRLGHDESFNPRARVGRDRECVIQHLLCGCVSIHAPAWGATVTPPAVLTAVTTFQSTRPRGARLGQTVRMPLGGSFQSTRPRGARQPGMWQPCAPTWVSIHAPAWGATECHRGIQGLSVCFNPRARVGRDAITYARGFIDYLFQSTRPRGARRGNPDRTGGPDSVSIHAPAWGATRPARRRTRKARVSIHAPAWGATSGRFAI